MNRLVYYGGDGMDGKEVGNYLIKYGEDKEINFTSKDEAIDFYESLNEEKALWNIDYMELMIAHIFADDTTTDLL